MLELFSLFAVAALWGATNPFIRRGSEGIDKVKSNSAAGKICGELFFLAKRWQYIVPFVLNQCGSVLYFLTLQRTALSVAVPVANSLSFVFTALVAHILGERPANGRVVLGTFAVAVGSVLCLCEEQPKA